MLLYCSTRLARTSWVAGSTTGTPAVKPAKGLPTPVAVPPTAPIVDEAASLVVVMLIARVPGGGPGGLWAAGWAFSWWGVWGGRRVPPRRVMWGGVRWRVARRVGVSPWSTAGPPRRAGGPAVRPRAVSVPAVPP